MKKPTGVALVKQEVSIESVIQQAIDKGVPVETMEKLLAMRRELKQEAAKEAYDRAMAAFQSECPTIKKTKAVKTRDGSVAYRYAPIESIVQQVQPYLQAHGFSYSTGMELKEGGVRVIVKVTHEMGHSEESAMEVPLGNKTQVMSDTQVTAAAQTFAKRYAFCNAFGILTGDEDNDAAPVKSAAIKPYRVVPIIPPADVEEAGSGFAFDLMNADEEREEQQATLNPPKRAKKKEGPSPASLKMDIANILHRKFGYTVIGKSAEEVSAHVLDATGFELKEENYAAIIEELNGKY